MGAMDSLEQGEAWHIIRLVPWKLIIIILIIEFIEHLNELFYLIFTTIL